MLFLSFNLINFVQIVSFVLNVGLNELLALIPTLLPRTGTSSWTLHLKWFFGRRLGHISIAETPFKICYQRINPIELHFHMLCLFNQFRVVLGVEFIQTSCQVVEVRFPLEDTQFFAPKIVIQDSFVFWNRVADGRQCTLHWLVLLLW